MVLLEDTLPLLHCYRCHTATVVTLPVMALVVIVGVGTFLIPVILATRSPSSQGSPLITDRMLIFVFRSSPMPPQTAFLICIHTLDRHVLVITQHRLNTMKYGLSEKCADRLHSYAPGDFKLMTNILLQEQSRNTTVSTLLTLTGHSCSVHSSCSPGNSARTNYKTTNHSKHHVQRNRAERSPSEIV